MTEARGVILRRVLREHRAWVWPLAVLLALNVVAVTAGVLPMSRSVSSAEARATAASRDAAAAATELKAATRGLPRRCVGRPRLWHCKRRPMKWTACGRWRTRFCRH